MCNYTLQTLLYQTVYIINYKHTEAKSVPREEKNGSGYDFYNWEYGGDVTIQNPNQKTTTADVSGDCWIEANFEEEPDLCLDPTYIDFGSRPQGWTGYETFTITNCGGGTLSYSLSESIFWIDVTPTSGQLGEDEQSTTETDVSE